MAFSQVLQWLNRIKNAPQGHVPHRQLLLISGDQRTTGERVTSLITALGHHKRTCSLGRSVAGVSLSVAMQDYKHVLGREFDVAVYDAHGPFRPSFCLALAGTITQGGTLILCCPALETWPHDPSILDSHFISHGFSATYSPFIRMLRDALRNDDYTAIWSQDQLKLPVSYGKLPAVQPDPRFLTADQFQSFVALKALFNRPHAHAALTALRGRGKSTLIGKLIVHWVHTGKTVLLTSPVKESVHSVFKQLARSDNRFENLSSLHYRDNRSSGEVRWVATDNTELLTNNSAILVIDEAASLPLPVLCKITANKIHCLLSTTVEGYEGSGQGFMTRFLPGWINSHNASHIVLEQPIRWLQDDPIEALLQRHLAFAEPIQATGCTQPVDLEPLIHQAVRLSELPSSDINQIIQLLRSAHYQTTPDDIMRIIDSPDTRLHVTYRGKQVVGVVMITVEGNLSDETLAAGIISGARRVKGHLSTQSLTLLSCQPEWLYASVWRVNRIAVLPVYQRQGIGKEMLKSTVEIAVENGCDCVTTSFGSTPALLEFWQHAGFILVKQGKKPDKASGNTSVLMVNPISNALTKQTELLTRLFNNDSQNTMSPDSDIAAIMRLRLQHFVNGSRHLDHMGAAFVWLCGKLTKIGITVPCLVNQIGERDVQTLVEEYKYAGKRQLVNSLRNSVKSLLLILHT